MPVLAAGRCTASKEIAGNNDTANQSLLMEGSQPKISVVYHRHQTQHHKHKKIQSVIF